MSASAVFSAPTGVSLPNVTVATMDSPDDERRWQRYVESHPRATGYHAWAWRRVVKHAFGHDSVYLAARVDDEVVGSAARSRRWRF
jgi:hypothetical protein